MAHCYASVDDLKHFVIDGGDSNWTGSDDVLLSLLEGASRTVDAFCNRSLFGSGFGPRTGANKYDFQDYWGLDLADDLLTITSVTAVDTYGASTRTLTDTSDFLKKPTGSGPYRRLELLIGASNVFGLAQEGNVVTGTWGYSNETASAGTIALAGTTSTTATFSGGSAWAGQTLLTGSEQVYVTASTGGTALTVARGQNGTTAAAGTAAASVYRYPRAVLTATLMVTAKRHKMAQAGITGDFGGGNLPIIFNRGDSERAILRATVGHLQRFTAV